MKPATAFLVLLLISPLLTGCGDSGSDQGKAPAEKPARRESRCPVSGTTFPIGAGFRAQIEGQKVELCSEGCRIRFEAEPSAFPTTEPTRR